MFFSADLYKFLLMKGIQNILKNQRIHSLFLVLLCHINMLTVHKQKMQTQIYGRYGVIGYNPSYD